MVPAPSSARNDPEVPAAITKFCTERYPSCGASGFGMSQADLGQILAEVAAQWNNTADEAETRGFLASLHMEELVLARACAAGNAEAWDVFLRRYRATLYESAYKIAREESAARNLADSLYAALYGVDATGHERPSKLRYYHGRGSLQGWLRMVVAQEYVNHCRATQRETSLDAALEDGRQFEASESEPIIASNRVEAAAAAELGALSAEERFLLASYFLDGRTLAEIAKLQQVHESTISRKLQRLTTSLRKGIRKRLVRSGMSPRQADEAMEGVDVRDLSVPVGETLRQGTQAPAFYKEKRGDEG